MSEVSIRDLRNHGGEVVDRVARGEQVTVTRDGKPMATLHPLPRDPLKLHELSARRQHLPPVDIQSLRDDLDQVLDPAIQ